MSGAAKVGYFLAFVSLGVAIAIRAMTGMWLNINDVFLALAAACAVFAIAKDWRVYREFFTMRTTKHGMSMGLTIVLMLVALVCVNFLANRHNKTWDVTQEKLNSLSDQSVSLMKGLQADMEVKVFYKGGAAQEERQRVKQNLQAYQELSHRLNVSLINLYVETDQALKYLNDQPDRETAAVFVFVEYHGKRVRAEAPFDESSLTSAMVKATREGENKVYIVRGHGEKDATLETDQGLSEFKRAMEEASFKIDTLNLIEKKEIPKDAAAVAIVGPSVAFLDEEIKWLRDYAQDGGKLFIALDPGQRHNLANLTKTFGIEFENNYLLTTTQITAFGAAGVLGIVFDPSSEITRSFPNGAAYALFPLASELRPAQGRDEKIEVKEIVKSDPHSFTVADATKSITPPQKLESYTVGMSSRGPGKEGKTFQAVVFGDSDFITNRGMAAGINRDLALNAFAQLTEQKDLISIRPKLPKGTVLMLSATQRLVIILIGLSIPLLLLISSAVIWFRRRGA
jgi:ABC-type uncharacterized transport system involved in gliding motility auxiliary subunit